MCLLGAPVRYDGSGKECRTITRQMQERVDFVATCPEIGIGMRSADRSESRGTAS